MKIIISVLLTCFSIASATAEPKATHLFMVGDSTMANKSSDKRPETGWGEKLKDRFESNLRIFNYAENGRSTKSFIDSGRWKMVADQLGNGDFVFIQFGHNDQKENDPSRFTNPYSSYRANLQRYIKEARDRGATPILLSSIVRRNFNEAGSLIATHGPYPAVMRDLAKDLNVDFIDLNTLSEQLVSQFGPEQSKKLYLHVQAGHKNYPDGVTDDTHLSPSGAEMIADLTVKILCENNHPLTRYLKYCTN